MTRGTLRHRWREEVYRTPLVSDSVRVLLLALADTMAEDGRVSVPRNDLARRLGGKHPRRITERYELAVRAGLLDRVRSGKPGVTAEYIATLPGSRTDRVRVERPDRPVSPFSLGADVRTSDEAHGADVRMMRIAAPIGVRTSAPTAHAQHGADVRPANGSQAPTAAGRAASSNGTTELRNDRGSAEPVPLHRAVDVDGAA